LNDSQEIGIWHWFFLKEPALTLVKTKISKWLHDVHKN
jgi:hypothetical protein